MSGLIVWVAPISLALSNLNSLLSIAIIFDAEEKIAPWITLSPTPPQPNTATEEPFSTLALFRTDPIPVITAQPIRQALFNGTSSEILTTEFSVTIVFWEKVPTPPYWWTGSLLILNLT